VVTPEYLQRNWVREIEAIVPQAKVVVVSGAITPTRKHEILNNVQQYDFVLVTYATLSQRTRTTLANGSIDEQMAYPEILTVPWGCVVCDEAHLLRGRNSQSTATMYKLSKLLERLWLLTGTPLVNNAGDVFPLLKLLEPRSFTSYWRFVEQFCNISYTPWATLVNGVKNEEQFNATLQRYMLRRTLSEVTGNAIPEPIMVPIYVELTATTLKALKLAKDEYRLQRTPESEEEPLTSAGAVVSAMRQLVAVDKNKLKAFKQLCNDAAQEPLIVWCWYRATVKLLLEQLPKNRPVWCIDGDVSAAKRELMCDEWRTFPNGVIIATLGSLSLGQNLQHAAETIFYEQDWLPSTNLQGLSRLRRLGQLRQVTVRVLIGERSVDVHVQRVQSKRFKSINRALFEEILLENAD